jgi:hypothetical protein
MRQPTKHLMMTQAGRTKLRIATWILFAYGALALASLFAGNVQSGTSVTALLWIPVAIGLWRESQVARFVARVLLAWSLAVVMVPLLTFVIDPLSVITISLPLIGEFRSTYAIAALMIMPWLLLTIWQWRVFSLPEVAAHFEERKRTRSAA